MSDLSVRVMAQLAEIGVEHERSGPRQVAVRVPTRMRGPLGLMIDCSERSVTMRAFVLRAPDRDPKDVYLRALRRNLDPSTWSFAADDDGDLYLTCRVALGALGGDGLDEVLGELSLLVDTAYEGLMRAGFDVPADAGVGPPPGVAGV